jgi:ATP-binding cassette subfamily B protein
MKPPHAAGEPAGIDWPTWGRLAGYLRRHPRIAAGVVLTAAGTATADSLFPLVTLGLVDELTERGAEAGLLRWGLLYLAILLLLCTCIAVFIRLTGALAARVAHDLREDGFGRLQDLSFSYYDRRPAGWIMARMTSDTDRLARILSWGLLDVTWGFVLMGVVTGLMLWLDWRLTLVVLCAVPALCWLSLRFQRVILRSARQVRKANSRLTLEEFRELTEDMRSASVRNAVQSALYLPIVLTLANVAAGLALAIGGRSVVAGGLSIGTLLAFLYWAARFYEPIQEVAATFAQLQMAQAAAERVLALIATEPEVRDTVAARAALERWSDRERPEGVAIDGGPERVEEIAFRGVSFAYGDGPLVLRDFDLTVRHGETVALVGPTGGGKSTIASLLCRFYEPTAGRLELDGTEYRERSLHWWQSRLGIVLQEPFLFRGTVRENVRYGRLEADDEEVEAAAAAVGLSDVVERLEHGWDTDVGARGDLLSTGEKQLVSFARAILADPDVLVLDEATSSIDVETERRIERALRAVLRGRTSFVIAHRLSTVRRADRILVVEGGRLVEEGTHARLLALGGRYHALATRQHVASPGPAA